MVRLCYIPYREFTETEWKDRGCFSEILQVASEQLWLFLGGLATWNGNDERKKERDGKSG